MGNNSYIVCDNCEEVCTMEGHPERLRMDPKKLCSFIQKHFMCQGKIRFVKGYSTQEILDLNGYTRYHFTWVIWDDDNWDEFYF